MKKQICCICGEQFEGFGNNPWPIVKDPEKRCCDKCNITEVIPARMTRELLPNAEQEEKEADK